MGAKRLARKAKRAGKPLFPATPGCQSLARCTRTGNIILDANRRLAALEPASDSSFSLLWAPLFLIFLALAYLVMRRVTAPRRPKDYGKFVKHGSRQVPAWRQAHESNDPM